MSVIINGSAGVTTNSGAVYNGIQSDTVKSATGTSVEFTSIPSWVKRITLTISSLSTNGTAPPIIQIGSGTYATSGYLGANSIIAAASVATVVFTTGFGVGVNTGNWSSATVANGSITLSLHSGNTWTCSGSVGTSTGTGIFLTSGSSGTAISGALDRVRLYIDGTQQFDAGTINILYE